MSGNREKTDKFTEERVPFPLPEGYPRNPPVGVLWVFEENGEPEAVDFLCPCGCGHSTYTPLNGNHPQRWTYSKGPNGPTLTPSIRWTGGCRAHFNITDGRVVWHSDSGK